MLTGETKEQQEGRLRQECAWAGGKVGMQLVDEVDDGVEPDELARLRLRRQAELSIELTRLSGGDLADSPSTSMQPMNARPGAGRSENAVDERFLNVCRLLNEHGVDYVVGGAVAMGLHGYVRATTDIDVMMPRDLENTRRALAALENLPLKAAREFDAEQVNAQVITIIGDDPRVDLMKAMGRLSYREATESPEERTVKGVRFRYLSLEALKKAKETGRTKDAADLEELARIEESTRRGPKQGPPRAKGAAD